MQQVMRFGMVLGLGVLGAGSLWAQPEGRVMPEGWHGDVGVGAVVAPAFLGSDETKTRVLPLVHVVAPGERLFFSTREGVGYTFLKHDAFEAGAALTYVAGRESDDDARIAAFEDIDAAAGAKLFAKYTAWRPFSLYADMTRQLGGAEGLRGHVGVGVYQPVHPAWALTGRLEAEWADGEDQEAWFGVTAPQSVASGLAAYRAEAGVRAVNLNLGAQYRFAPQWQWRVGGGVSQLVGDAADSPISAEDTGLNLMTGVSYKF